jgi:hypothetical protein
VPTPRDAGRGTRHRADVPVYSELIGPAGAAIGEPGLWTQVSAERALDLCPPSLQPEGPPPWPGPFPLRPSAGDPGALPPAVAAALVDGRSLAYFTLGTIKNTDTADLATGLEALAGTTASWSQPPAAGWIRTSSSRSRPTQ